jgi:hypothetical protein
MLKTYHGSCHCGKVRFEADIDLTQPTFRCNCSICRRNRFWPAVIRPEAFRLIQGQDELQKYLFNSMRNEHWFCRTCGVRGFGIGNPPGLGKVIGVNLGCLDDVTDEELAAAPIVYIDGAHDNWGAAPAVTKHM